MSDRALSGDWLEIDKGRSAMDFEQAELRDPGIGYNEVKLLAWIVDTKVVPLEVARERAGEAGVVSDQIPSQSSFWPPTYLGKSNLFLSRTHRRGRVPYGNKENFL